MHQKQADYEEHLKALAQNYYGKILSGEVAEAGDLLKKLALLHNNHDIVTKDLEKESNML